MKIEFFRHNLDDDDVAELVDTLRSPFLTTGPKTRAFEERFARYLGLADAAACTSWTSAAFLVLQAWGIGPGDEVIVPPLTFVSSANIVIHCGARPVFVDVERETGVLDPARVAEAITDRTRAIMPVHLYGQMADMRALRALAEPRGIRLLEDAAHAIESRRDDYGPGQLGDVACFSFYATKNLACGEGGAAAARDPGLVEHLKRLRLHGMDKSAADRYHKKYQHWDMTELGYKANLSDVQSSLLLRQLEKLEARWKRREELSRYYESRFRAAGIEFPVVLAGSRSARHLFTVWAPRGRRDDALARLQEAGIGVAVNFRAVHLLAYYRNAFGFAPGAFPVAEEIGDRTITIPLYPKLTDAEAEYVADSVVEALRA
jgi:UDP-4-amino-4-deoxy-L-arabinose-oxoglutarate aminotransferase